MAEIAKEKAGIIKKNIPVIIGQSQSETEPVFKEKAQEQNSEIFFADQYYKTDYLMFSVDQKQIFNIKKDDQIIYRDLKLDLLGNYQSKNVITVLRSIDLLKRKGYYIHKENIYNGLSNVVKNTGLLGRWQILSYNPQIVCDTGHNAEGLSLVVDQIKQTSFKRLHWVFGVVNDKSLDNILNLLPKEAIYYFTKANIPRALNQEILKDKASNFGLFGESFKSVSLALANAKKNAESNDLIFIGGSTFIVAEVV